MKTQNLYESLEQEIKERKEKLTAKSWRGDLSRKGLEEVSWGDLMEIETQPLKSK